MSVDGADGRLVLAHVALALGRYLEQAGRERRPVPAEVRTLAALLVDAQDASPAATGRRSAPLCASCGADGHGLDMRERPILLALADAARVLGISKRSAERMAAAGELPTVRIGGVTRVRRGDLDALVANLPSTSRGGFRDEVTTKAGAAPAVRSAPAAAAEQAAKPPASAAHGPAPRRPGARGAA